MRPRRPCPVASHPNPRIPAHVEPILAVVVTLVLLLAGVGVARSRNRSLAVHDRDAFDRFAAECADRFPEPVVRHTFDFLAERHGAMPAHAVVRLGDDLRKAHGLVELDLEDAVVLIADRVGGRLPAARDLDELDGRVRTVEDLMRFLAPFAPAEGAPG